MKQKIILAALFALALRVSYAQHVTEFPQLNFGPEQHSFIETNDSGIILDQNVPNPFSKKTVIHYSVPDTIHSARLYFYNASEELIRVVILQEFGSGSFTLYGSEFSPGIFTYSLLVDDQIVATKKMIKK